MSNKNYTTGASEDSLNFGELRRLTSTIVLSLKTRVNDKILSFYIHILPFSMEVRFFKSIDNRQLESYIILSLFSEMIFCKNQNQIGIEAETYLASFQLPGEKL